MPIIAAPATAIVRTMAGFLAIVLFLLPAWVAAEITVTPSNSIPDQVTTPLLLTGPGISTDTTPSYDIAPLTVNVGMGDVDSVGLMHFTGSLILGNETSKDNVGPGEIVFISCDPTVGFINASAIANTVSSRKPTAIILYSLLSPQCMYNGTAEFTTLYTMTSNISSFDVQTSILSAGPVTGTVPGNRTSDPSNNHPNQNTNPGGPAPTTAVAMSILYSITGIITLLFLVIIATGAVRAHRHPERYGPRNGNTGRPRQSRAKGLARAMLETLPIVKFGDPEPAKSVNRDIELEDGNDSTHSTEHPRTTEGSGALKAIPPGAVVESGMNNDTQATAKNSGEVATPMDGELGCSICTEDFTTGDDVRVLPCGHKYHPACIDPWLLNVSGTCPLCRHDLRPTATDEATTEGDDVPATDAAAENVEAVATTEVQDESHRRRVSRLLDLHRLRHAPPEERIAALRNLREQSQREGETVENAEEQGRRARLTSRLRSRFGIRTRRENDDQASQQELDTQQMR